VSLRTAIANALVKQGFVSVDEMYSATGMNAVDSIASAIITDSLVNENAEQPGLWAMVRKATDPTGIDGQNTAHQRPNAAEVVSRLRDQGVVITVDQQAVIFGTRPQ
jgi:hypothetical protein